MRIHGPGGRPVVSGHNGLTIDPGAAGTEIDDLMINNFPDDGVMIKADEVTLLDDYIGADVSGVSAYPNQGFGVQVQGNGDQIGTNNGGACPYACSLIAGNGKANILLDGSSSGARIEGSYIGTGRDRGGALRRGNRRRWNHRQRRQRQDRRHRRDRWRRMAASATGAAT